jgi:hypothetical protein
VFSISALFECQGRSPRKLVTAGVIGAVCVLGLLGAGCTNAFSEMANKTSDAALLYAAQMSIDKGDYAAAIESIGLMSAKGQTNHTVRSTLASAYAGRCGLNLLSLAQDISNLSSRTLFEMLMYSFKGADANDVADCQAAETQLLAISSPSNDEYVQLAFVELAKVGAILAAKADSDHDGTPGPGFNSCDSNTISDALVADVGTGITIAVASLAGTGVGTSATAPISAICDSIDSALHTTGFCDQTSATDFDPTELLALRSLIKANEIGLKTCNNTVSNCPCP